MKKVCLVFITSLVLPMLTHASLATEGVGGGGGVLCETPEGTTLELLDFWEAHSLRNMRIPKVSGDPEEQALKALRRWFSENPSLTMSERIELGEILGRIVSRIAYDADTFIPADIEFLPPSDALAKIVKRGCRLVGIATYYDVSNVIRLDRRHYLNLSDTDKAGLLVHETVYRFMRKHLHVPNSVTARGITACLFSQDRCPEMDLSHEIPQEGTVFKCHTADTEFVIYSVINPKFDVTLDMWAHPGYLESTFLDLWRIQFLKTPEPLVTKVYYQFPDLESGGIRNSQDIIERVYRSDEVQARSADAFFRNFPYFKNHEVVRLEFVMNQARSLVANIRGALGASDFSCQPY